MHAFFAFYSYSIILSFRLLQICAITRLIAVCSTLRRVWYSSNHICADIAYQGGCLDFNLPLFLQGRIHTKVTFRTWFRGRNLRLQGWQTDTSPYKQFYGKSFWCPLATNSGDNFRRGRTQKHNETVKRLGAD